MAVALVISLVMFNTLLFAEGQRRTISGGSDAQQSGAMASYLVERLVRLGGSGLNQVSNLVGGCRLSLKTSADVSLLPLPSGLAAPFNGLAGLTLRAAPVLIANGSGSSDDSATSTTPDALIIMAGSSPGVINGFQGTSSATASLAHVVNSVGLATGDLLVAVEQDGSSSLYGPTGLCRLAKVTSSVETDSSSACYRQSSDNCGQSVRVGGSLTASDGLAPGGTAYTGLTQYADLGTAPILQILALGPTPATAADLRVYDILDQSSTSLSDGVVNLQALYGLRDAGNTSNCVVTSWVAPVGSFNIATLTGTSGAASLARICAIRLGLITRSALQEKNAVDAPATWTMFADQSGLSLSGTRTGTALKYRYRQFDAVIPVRNMAMGSAS